MLELKSVIVTLTSELYGATSVWVWCEPSWGWPDDIDYVESVVGGTWCGALCDDEA